jgi:shikimate dehydrogenase
LIQPSFLIGLIGAGIQASRTPAMHEREAAELGLRYTYKLIDLDRLNLGAEALPELLIAAERMGFDGLNVTHPCKQTALAHLSELSDEARAIGAVNTIVLRDGRRIGSNTDASGFAQSFRRGLPGAALSRVVLLGAGGAGAAVAHALFRLGAERLTVFDLEMPRAESLAAKLSTCFGPGSACAGLDLEAAVAGADGLIHATPTGMATHPGMPLPEHLLLARHWLAEVVYFPLETELLRAAKHRGCRILDGGGMAVFQAAEAFRLFTGMQPDADRMRRHFISLGEREMGES